MATQFKLHGGSPTAEAYASAWISSQTDTTATIVVRSYARLVYSNGSVQSSGVYARAYGNGSWQGLQHIFGDCYPDYHRGNEWCYTDHYFTVSKSSEQTSAYWASEFHSWVDDTDLGSVVFNDDYVSVPAIDYEPPHDPTDVSAVRESDNKNIVSWAQDGTGMGGLYPWSGFYILRRTDGGELSRIADLANWEATSYADTTTAANHFYEYAVQAYGPGGTSEIVPAPGILYNTPTAPTKITASRLAETTVKLEISNPANTATALEMQRSEDALSWEDVASVEGSPVTETADEPGGGTFYYRARNTRGDLVSDWSPVSNAVVTICPPAAPTLKVPASGVVVSKAQETITFEHRHSPIDGSGQTAAQYRMSTDDGATYAYHDIEGEDEKLVLENTFAVNSKVTYGVRTKGAHDDYGPWSDNRVFYVYQAPSVAFAQPADGFTVENTPIAIKLQYDDPSGSLVSATLNVSDGVKTAYVRSMGADTEGEIQSSEWTPENGKVYTLTATVRSSSTLTATATREISVDFVLPQPASIHIENDPETGHASLVVYVEDAADLEAPKSISVWRESKDGRVLIGDGLQAGAGLVDRFAPLNADYRYIITSFADSGAANSKSFDNRINSLWWFVYFDDGMAKAMWEPSGSRSSRRTKDELKERDGSEWPVLIQGKNKSHKVDFSGWVETKEEADAFEDMTLASGGKVYKGLKGEVFHCHAEADITDSYEYGDDSADVKVTITRVRGGAL